MPSRWARHVWTQMTQWILGQSDKTTLDKIEASWPK